MPRWQIDPEVIEVLNGNKNLTADTFNRIFGAATTADIDDYPYSIQRMFWPPGSAGDATGLGADNLTPNVHLTGDLELSGAEVDQTTVGGVWSGIYDVTSAAFAGGAKGDGVTNDYAAIKACVDAAMASTGTSKVRAVFFPRTTANVYIVNAGSAIPGIEIKPNFMYLAAPGVTIKRTDGSYGSGVDPGIFGTGSDWAGATNPGVQIRGFTIDGNAVGVHGIKIAGGGWAAIELCFFKKCYKDTANYQRAGVFLNGVKSGTISNCRFEDCDQAWLTANAAAWCHHNTIGYSAVSSFTNIGLHGMVRSEDAGVYQPIYYANRFSAPRRVGASGTGDRASAIAMAGKGAVAFGNVVDMSEALDYQDGIEISDNFSQGKYNIAIGNMVVVTKQTDGGVTQLRGITAEQAELQIIVDNVVSGPRIGLGFTTGIKTTVRGGAATYGKNRIMGNQVGPDIGAPYTVNKDATHGDVYQEISAPLNVAVARLSDVVPNPEIPYKSGWKWESLGIGLTNGGAASLAAVEEFLAVGGTFTKAGPYSVAYLGLLEHSRWNQLSTGAPNGAVNRLVTHAAGQDKNGLVPVKEQTPTVLAVGAFTNFAGSSQNRLALVDLRGQTITAIGKGLGGGDAYDAQYFDNVLSINGWLVVGAFTTVVNSDNTTRTVKRVGFYDLTADAWSAWPNSSYGVNDGTVKCCLGFTEYAAIVGGSFTNVQNSGGAVAANNIAVTFNVGGGGGTEGFYKIRATNPGFNGAVNALCAGPGFVLAGGAFTKDTGTTAYGHIAALVPSLDASTDFTYRNIGGVSGTVYSIRRITVTAAPWGGDALPMAAFVVCYDGGVSLLYVRDNGTSTWDFAWTPIALRGLPGAKVIQDAVAFPDKNLIVIAGNFLPANTAEAYGQDLNQIVRETGLGG